VVRFGCSLAEVRQDLVEPSPRIQVVSEAGRVGD
jgi:hypothetical protein